MRGFRFYEELTDKGKATESSKGNVIAAYVADGPFWGATGALYECFSALLFESNSVVCGGSVSLDYLRDNTRRVSEARAREIHPALFDRLDD